MSADLAYKLVSKELIFFMLAVTTRLLFITADVCSLETGHKTHSNAKITTLAEEQILLPISFINFN